MDNQYQMDNFDGIAMPPYLDSTMPMDAETYRGVLPSLGLPETLTPTFDTSDFGMYVGLNSQSPD